MTNAFFRFVRGEVATVDDFKSQGALGKTMRFTSGDDAQRRWNEGVSVYDSVDYACELAAAGGYRIGSYIAKISLPAGHGLDIVQTGRDKHHYTIFADAATLLALVREPATRIPGSRGLEDLNS